MIFCMCCIVINRQRKLNSYKRWFPVNVAQKENKKDCCRQRFLVPFPVKGQRWWWWWCTRSCCASNSLWRQTRTGTLAWWTRKSLTLPRKVRRTLLMPLVPTIIKSASSALDASMMDSPTFPVICFIFPPSWDKTRNCIDFCSKIS